ncbi:MULTISPECIES: helix-turn-helix domain-containing protein [Sphingobacterium]|uniref:helix-turn-helix domain-containing protein n=1 Tax=Sphingobacterium TaxID=28453 RepID=UPI00069A8BE4|nr:AraC family transcriptional regulator [Sphingobacterium sp. Ag1]
MELFPTIDLQEFRKDQLAGNQGYLYSELHGEHHISRPHQHHFFLLVLFDQAEGIHTIDFKDYHIDRHQIHILFPKQVHSWKLGANTTGFQLMVDREHFEKFSPNFHFSFAYYQRTPVISLSSETFALLYYEFNAIRKELEDHNCVPAIIYSRTAVVASILSKEVQKIVQNEQNNDSNPRLLKLQELIDIHFQHEKSVSFYAKQLNISTPHLTKICRQKLEVSPSQLIQQRTILEAKRLLKATDLSIKEISFKLGFVDSPYFSNFFKQHTGLNPKQFRTD